MGSILTGGLKAHTERATGAHGGKRPLREAEAHPAIQGVGHRRYTLRTRFGSQTDRIDERCCRPTNDYHPAKRCAKLGKGMVARSGCLGTMVATIL